MDWSFNDHNSEATFDLGKTFLCVYRDGVCHLMFTQTEARHELEHGGNDVPAHVMAEGIDWMLEKGHW